MGKYLTFILSYILSVIFYGSAFSQWRFPDCSDLTVTKIEFIDFQHDTLLISVYNECDTCVQHVYTGLIAYKNDDTLAIDEFLSGRLSPPNNGELSYTLITKKYFEIEEIDRIQMAFGLCDSLHLSPLIGISTENLKVKNPSEFLLFQNYPNPFNPNTKIKYSIMKISLVKLKIFDIRGREIATLVDEEKSPGNYEFDFNASNLSSGIYFYRFQAGNFSETKKLILLR